MNSKRTSKNRISKFLFVLVPVVLAGFVFSAEMLQAEVVYSWTWEDPGDPWGGWSPNNGVWQVGEPTGAPITAFSPLNCAATILDGYYTKDTDSRLESPEITIRSVASNEEVILRFWQWFSYSREYYDDDRGRVQVDVYDNGSWTGWTDLITMYDYSKAWSPCQVDLTAYAGKKIRLGFFHVDYSDVFGHHENWGWYVDDVVVRIVPQQVLPLNQKVDFETGWDDWWWGGWWANRGVWEVGAPTSGPGAPYSTPNCAGTILDGKYPLYTDSRLVSPPFDLPSMGTVEVRFKHWFSFAVEYYDDDEGRLDISVWESGAWSAWETLETYRKDSGIWTPRNVNIDLLQYGGERVRISYFLVDNSDVFGHHENAGWYIDDFLVYWDGQGQQYPKLDIDANGQDGTVLISGGDKATVTVELDSGDFAGTPVDLWVGVLTIYGCYWCDSAGNWSRTRTPYLQGSLGDIPETVVFDQPLPLGVYTFFFIMDGLPDGVFNINLSLYDLVNVVCKQ